MIDRKRLGQYFTGTRLARSLACLAQAATADSILDPMAGSGDMLVAANEIGAQPKRMGAIELVPETAAMCLERCCNLAADVRVETGSAFDSRSWQMLDGVWELVITNPPYVRYQTGSTSINGQVKVPAADEVRSGLVDILEQRETLGDGERRVFVNAAESYSGLSDLAVPSWLLAAAAVAENGRLAMVVPTTWLSRDYAVAVVAVLRRFFEIEFVVSDADASWFDSALVRTNLVVARRVSDKQSSLLGGRHLVVNVPSSAGSDESIVGRAFSVAEPEQAFAEWAMNSAHPASTPLRSEWSDELDLVASLSAASSRQKWIAAGQSRGSASSSLEFSVPRGIREIIDRRLDRLTDLKGLGWRVGQGLRTGANEFFYVDVLTDGLFHSALLPEKRLAIPPEVIRPAIRRQSDLLRQARSSDRIGTGVLYLKGWALRKDADSSDWRPIDGDLEELIGVAVRKTYRRGKTIRSLPELSAVRTNVGPGRFWYHLPQFTERHEPDIFIPRVNGGIPLPYLNGKHCGCERRVVDANFSTIWADLTAASRLNPFVLIALLSSTWTTAILETLGTVMGGGALKLEATHLRRLPLPNIDDKAESSLVPLGRTIAGYGVSADIRYAVDCVVAQHFDISEESILSLRRFAAGLLRARTTRSHSRLAESVRPRSSERIVDNGQRWANHEDCLRESISQLAVGYASRL